MITSPALRLGAIVLGAMFATQASAADDYKALLRAKKFAEVETAANGKLAQDPANADAMVARTNAILGAGPERIEEAVSQAEKCVALHANNGRCHLALGEALGTKAMIKGIMASLGSAGTIRDSLKKAVELNPGDFDARFSLLDFYRMAPFMVGGGKGKADNFAKESGALNPEGGKLMLATLDLGEGNTAKAEAAALAAKPGADEDLQQKQEELLAAIGASYISDKKFADAERILREAQKRFASSDNVMYMGARLQQEQGRHKEAVAALEQVLLKIPRPHVHYRIGKSWQALGEKAKAVAAYEKAVSAKSGLASSLRSDAQAQLKVLKG